MAVCLSYLIFVSPLITVLHLGLKNGSIWFDISICWYWCHYSVNFFIYFLRSKQYRHAFTFFLQSLLSWMRQTLSINRTIDLDAFVIVQKDLLLEDTPDYRRANQPDFIQENRILEQFDSSHVQADVINISSTEKASQQLRPCQQKKGEH